MAHATWQQFYQPAFVAAFAFAAGGVFVLILTLRILSGRHLADASVDAIAASCPNTAYVGFPLCMIVFGTASMTPTTIATMLVTCVFFSTAIVLIEVGLQTERTPHKLVLAATRSLVRNPLIVSPIAGVLVAGTHVTVPPSAETLLKLLSGATSPCALVSLGLFLAEKRPSGTALGGSLLLTGSKLLLQPVLTWWLAARVFALPTGASPFMLAQFYRREAHITSRTILLSTLGSLVSLSLLLLYMPHNG
jgi:malonate transporter